MLKNTFKKQQADILYSLFSSKLQKWNYTNEDGTFDFMAYQNKTMTT